MIIKNASFITSAARPEQFIKKTKPTIAVVGKSNVGKSSFINALANMKKLAKTSDTPGRTRLVNYFDFGDFVLADLPGYGYAKVSKEEKDKWAVTMEKFFADKSNYDYVFALAGNRYQNRQSFKNAVKKSYSLGSEQICHDGKRRFWHFFPDQSWQRRGFGKNRKGNRPYKIGKNINFF